MKIFKKNENLSNQCKKSNKIKIYKSWRETSFLNFDSKKKNHHGTDS